MADATPSRGVYFLANDRIADITIAFLNSFRLHNPDLALCLIPFNDQFARIAALADLYEFSIYHNAETLVKCDEMSLGVSGQPCGAYRKLCAFDGPFDQFIYIDCDTLVLRDVTFFFAHLETYDWVFTHSDMPVLKQFVWKDTIDQAGLLSPEQIAFSANTGCFCSRKGVFDIDEALAAVPEVARIFAQYMDFHFMEQPYINYLVVTSNRNYSSLHRLNEAAGNLAQPREQWAGLRARIGENVFLLHWAGSWHVTDQDAKIYRWLARLGLKVRSPGVRRALPHKRLWKHYRYYRYSPRAAGG